MTVDWTSRLTDIATYLPFLMMVKASALSSFGIHLDRMTNLAGLSGPDTAPIIAGAADMLDAPKNAVMGTTHSRTPMHNKLADSVL